MEKLCDSPPEASSEDVPVSHSLGRSPSSLRSNHIHRELAALKRKVKRLTKQLADLEHLVNVAIAHFPEVKYRS